MFTLIFHPDADEEIQELDDRMRGKAILALELLSAQGNQLRYPHTEPLRNGLIELRAGSKDITRTIFAFAKGKKIYILRTFVKKTPKTPPAEIKLALTRLEEMTNES
ncbi:type II toxin-antitoxin system RelE/ParE family toxin [Salmonella enterica]|uniref:Phage-related protein n=11 Tax=Salmonella enterica TaxID=28901 RepID=A0A379S305_SALER|nr:type II toxin-antitoxin system RelE/ParE family toxin [Salmonella enterica]EAA0559104.1 type II toxin-antitoxin system RelE/ParE family toxin [Salmonella enterica subsp. enterica serovar Lexington]EAA6774409.1 type II toxin-antitoxin system RelE/ParE family toxin [Salmonella enterica subsp. enterica serovar Braenderup]EAB8825242.1 type II toxin-antitoxin system RelE/ParE family toxin [Salmonella enterica subsp. enterica serovar Infantis]EAT8891056.1 type II toxin-antitoxin system RelE/ParE f